MGDDTVRCLISYKRGPFYGVQDIGVSSEDDPTVSEAIRKMESNGWVILGVRFW